MDRLDRVMLTLTLAMVAAMLLAAFYAVLDSERHLRAIRADVADIWRSRHAATKKGASNEDAPLSAD